MIRDEIKFVEENWYSHVAYDEAGDNPAAVEPGTDDQADEHRPQNVEEFEAMERAPGLYTESPDAGSPARDDAVDAGLPHDDAVKFLENNWHLSFDIVNVEDDEGDVTTGSASPDGNNTDRADTLDELQNEAGEADDERSHDELTYPWGGFRENH